MAFSILLTEDDPMLRMGLTELFTREGYRVIPASCAKEAREKRQGQIDLIVLDVTLPDGDGVSLCREWRGQGVETPILFLTAKDEEFEIVRGLDAGGDDYVTKPFRMQELLSRVRALLRRNVPANVQSVGEFELDGEHMQARKNGVPLPLTLTEFRLLNMLMRTRAIVTRNQLLETLWDEGGKYVDDNTLSVHLSRLREKVGAEHIRTVRGVGYQWIP